MLCLCCGAVWCAVLCCVCLLRVFVFLLIHIHSYANCAKRAGTLVLGVSDDASGSTAARIVSFLQANAASYPEVTSARASSSADSACSPTDTACHAPIHAFTQTKLPHQVRRAYFALQLRHQVAASRSFLPGRLRSL